MEIWVDELPEKCEECPFCKIEKLETIKLNLCLLENREKYHEEDVNGIKFKVLDCPLQTILSHDIETRKHIRNMVAEYMKNYGFDINEWEDLLDLIEGDI